MQDDDASTTVNLHAQNVNRLFNMFTVVYIANNGFLLLSPLPPYNDIEIPAYENT
jgi:hypothetical protein